jgi:hypothetical protein
VKRLLPFLFVAATAFAAVDGTVINRTTSRPQAGAEVGLYKIGQAGPELIESTKSDAAGRFSFNRTLEPGPNLLETQHAGVTYNTMIPPGRPSTGIQISVYDSSKRPGAAQVSQHMIFLEPSAEQLAVTETFIFENNGTLTYDNPDGTLRFYAPAAAKDSLHVNATEPGGMPLERFPEDTKQAGVRKLAFPIKPGETRIDVTYTLPSAAQFSTRSFYPAVPTRLVTPNGVTLAGDGLRSLGQEPQTQAALYETRAAEFKVAISGTGSLRSAQNAAADSGGDDSGPTISVILPPGFEDHRMGILVLALAALALGFVLLYRKRPAAGKSGS